MDVTGLCRPLWHRTCRSRPGRGHHGFQPRQQLEILHLGRRRCGIRIVVHQWSFPAGDLFQVRCVQCRIHQPLCTPSGRHHPERKQLGILLGTGNPTGHHLSGLHRVERADHLRRRQIHHRRAVPLRMDALRGESCWRHGQARGLCIQPQSRRGNHRGTDLRNVWLHGPLGPELQSECHRR